ncbi:MAG: SMP-30/gluconolactonase/LRE family protein [Planctomycetaceae bacterium]|nr:SMP-30/gluconolactonase/LRE family protein [Planctomycetaceae bacterium]
MIRQNCRSISLALVSPILLMGVSLPCALLRGEEDLATKLQQAKVEQFAQSPAYADAPVCCNSVLYFGGNGFWKVQPDGPVKAFALSPSGAVVRQEQDLLLCGTGLKALLNFAPDGKVHVLADKFEEHPLNSLNDVTIDAQGRIYWTDPVGSSREKVIGKVFRLTPDGTVKQVIGNLAFPAGIEVDPTGKSLVIIESQTNRVLKYSVPENDDSFGEPSVLYDIGGAGGDGCAFDAEGNLWLADFHRKETGQGRVTVVSPEGKLVGHVNVPAKVVSNIAFGGERFDEVYCTTAEPPAVFRIEAGVVGFAGHRAPQVAFQKEIDVKSLSKGGVLRPRKLSRLEKRRLRQMKPDQKPGLSGLILQKWTASWSEFKTTWSR